MKKNVIVITLSLIHIYIPGIGMDTLAIQQMPPLHELKKLYKIPKDAFLFVSVGEINKNKNHMTIIKALESLNNRKLWYLICGEGALEQSYRTYIRDHQLQVILLGQRNDVPAILKMCDVFIFPSLREGLGLAALEAMACGLPLITSNVHGICDYAQDGVSAITCDPDDGQAFANAMLKMFEDHNLRNLLSANNVKAVKKYDIHRIENEMLSIYKKHIKGDWHE